MSTTKDDDKEIQAHYRLECLKLADKFALDGKLKISGEQLTELAECFANFVWPKDQENEHQI